MKIAIVCGHFLPEMGYVEVYFAKELAKAHHQVAVITTSAIPAYVKHLTAANYAVGKQLHHEHNYAIFRLKPIVSLGQMVLSYGLKKIIQDFSPNVIIVIGVGKFFPFPVFNLKGNYKINTLLGDNEDSFENKTTLIKIKNHFLKKIKAFAYVKAIKKSTFLFTYTPETVGLVKKIVDKKLHSLLEKKSVSISLGFDEETFYFNENERNTKRKQLGLTDEIVIVTATRIVPYKRLEKLIDWVDEANKQGINLHYIIIGFFDDAYGNEVKTYIQQKKYASQFTCLPFLPNNEVRKLYAAADIAYFPTAVISIFEAMGTGLPLVLPQKNNISHILDNKTSGFYIENENINDAIKRAILLINASYFNRQELIVQNSQKFSWKSIVEKVVNAC